jgi:Family of unknown function (DUF6177)
MSTPLHPIPLPGLRPWKSFALDRALLEAPAGTLPAVVMEREASPSYGLVAYLRATGVPWFMPDADGGLEDAPSLTLAARSPLPAACLAVRGRVLHPADHTTVIGDYTAKMLESLGARPQHSGRVEPLAAEWNTTALTEWFRGHMPWSALVISGAHLTGLLTVSRADGGVLESFDALITNGHPVTPEALDTVLGLAHSLRSMDFSAELHFGADHGGVQSGGDQYRVPLATMLGPELARDPAAQARPVPGVDIRSLGSRPFQSLTVRYPIVNAWDGGKGQELSRTVFPGI